MRGGGWRAVTHPSTVAAIGLLALNDHVLKARWPGLVTGKLSDLAGLYCFPILLAAVLGHVRVHRPGSVAFAATAAAFTLVKTWAPATVIAEAVLGRAVGPSTIRRDITDLVALVMLVPAWRLWNRHRAEGPATWWRRSACTVVLVGGLSASAATSYGIDDWSAERVEVRGSEVVVFDAFGDPEYVSDSGGRWWRELLYDEAMPAGARRPMQQALCLSTQPDRCIRVVRGSRVEERTGEGDWVTAFQLPPEAGSGRRTLDTIDGPDDHDLDHTFLGLVEAPTAEGRTPTVVVAMGSEGILLRSPDGVWDQVGLGSARPVQDVVEDDSWRDPLFLDSFFLTPIIVGLVAFSAAGAIGITIAVRARRRLRSAAGSWPPPPPPG